MKKERESRIYCVVVVIFYAWWCTRWKKMRKNSSLWATKISKSSSLLHVLCACFWLISICVFERDSLTWFYFEAFVVVLSSIINETSIFLSASNARGLWCWISLFASFAKIENYFQWNWNLTQFFDWRKYHIYVNSTLERRKIIFVHIFNFSNLNFPPQNRRLSTQ